MKTHLFIYANLEKARLEFQKFIESIDVRDKFVRVSPQRLIAETISHRYQFAPSSPNLREKLCGMKCDYIVVDEFASLDEEATAFLYTRLRRAS